MVGFICYRVDTPPDATYHAVRLLLPDAVVLIMSVITFVAMKRTYSDGDNLSNIQRPEQRPKKGVVTKFIETFGEITIVIGIGRR